MDLLKTIKADIDAVPDGAHSLGLRSILQHIEVAYRHLDRGQKESDSTAYNDAIYRTNQAFEGSVKEAYRVLAGKEPGSLTPARIENFLERNLVFRERVLTQLKDYRQKWRNPSTHDYNLFFDEDEAFLAIISVSAFAKLLVRQIAEKIAFVESAKQAEQTPAAPQEVNTRSDLVDRIVSLINGFSTAVKSNYVSESSYLGAIAGYMSSIASDLNIETGLEVGGTRVRVDFSISNEHETVFLELKRWKQGASWRDAGLSQLFGYMGLASVTRGVLLLFDPDFRSYASVGDFASAGSSVRVVAPSAEAERLR